VNARNTVLIRERARYLAQQYPGAAVLVSGHADAQVAWSAAAESEEAALWLLRSSGAS
jgi:hypothetical protein